MKATITVEHETIVRLIHEHLLAKLGEAAAPDEKRIIVKVRSKQNYRNHEWEVGELQVTYEGEL